MPGKIDEYYQCDECKMLYTTYKWAEKCEKWCREHGTCNVEIMKHAVGSYGIVSEKPLKLFISRKDEKSHQDVFVDP